MPAKFINIKENNFDKQIINDNFSKSADTDYITKNINNGIITIGILNEFKNTLLQHFIENYKENIDKQFLNVVKFYLDNNVPLNNYNNNGESVYSMAIKSNNIKLFNLIINKIKKLNLNLNIKDKYGNYPIFFSLGDINNCPKNVIDNILLLSSNNILLKKLDEGPFKINDIYEQDNIDKKQFEPLYSFVKDKLDFDNSTVIKKDDFLHYLKWNNNDLFNHKIEFKCLHVSTDIFKYFIENDSYELNRINNNGETIIHKLFNYCDKTLMKKLLETTPEHVDNFKKIIKNINDNKKFNNNLDKNIKIKLDNLLKFILKKKHEITNVIFDETTPIEEIIRLKKLNLIKTITNYISNLFKSNIINQIYQEDSNKNNLLKFIDESTELIKTNIENYIDSYINDGHRGEGLDILLNYIENNNIDSIDNSIVAEDKYKFMQRNMIEFIKYNYKFTDNDFYYNNIKFNFLKIYQNESNSKFNEILKKTLNDYYRQIINNSLYNIYMPKIFSDNNNRDYHDLFKITEFVLRYNGRSRGRFSYLINIPKYIINNLKLLFNLESINTLYINYENMDNLRFQNYDMYNEFDKSNESFLYTINLLNSNNEDDQFYYFYYNSTHNNYSNLTTRQVMHQLGLFDISEIKNNFNIYQINNINILKNFYPKFSKSKLEEEYKYFENKDKLKFIHKIWYENYNLIHYIIKTYKYYDNTIYNNKEKKKLLNANIGFIDSNQSDIDSCFENNNKIIYLKLYKNYNQCLIDIYIKNKLIEIFQPSPFDKTIYDILLLNIKINNKFEFQNDIYEGTKSFNNYEELSKSDIKDNNIKLLQDLRLENNRLENIFKIILGKYDNRTDICFNILDQKVNNLGEPPIYKINDDYRQVEGNDIPKYYTEQSKDYYDYFKNNIYDQNYKINWNLELYNNLVDFINNILNEIYANDRIPILQQYKLKYLDETMFINTITTNQMETTLYNLNNYLSLYIINFNLYLGDMFKKYNNLIKNILNMINYNILFTNYQNDDNFPFKKKDKDFNYRDAYENNDYFNINKNYFIDGNEFYDYLISDYEYRKSDKIFEEYLKNNDISFELNQGNIELMIKYEDQINEELSFLDYSGVDQMNDDFKIYDYNNPLNYFNYQTNYINEKNTNYDIDIFFKKINDYYHFDENNLFLKLLTDPNNFNIISSNFFNNLNLEDPLNNVGAVDLSKINEDATFVQYIDNILEFDNTRKNLIKKYVNFKFSYSPNNIRIESNPLDWRANMTEAQARKYYNDSKDRFTGLTNDNIYVSYFNYLTENMNIERLQIFDAAKQGLPYFKIKILNNFNCDKYFNKCFYNYMDKYISNLQNFNVQMKFYNSLVHFINNMLQDRINDEDKFIYIKENNIIMENIELYIVLHICKLSIKYRSLDPYLFIDIINLINLIKISPSPNLKIINSHKPTDLLMIKILNGCGKNQDTNFIKNIIQDIFLRKPVSCIIQDGSKLIDLINLKVYKVNIRQIDINSKIFNTDPNYNSNIVTNGRSVLLNYPLTGINNIIIILKNLNINFNDDGTISNFGNLLNTSNDIYYIKSENIDTNIKLNTQNNPEYKYDFINIICETLYKILYNKIFNNPKLKDTKIDNQKLHLYVDSSQIIDIIIYIIDYLDKNNNLPGIKEKINYKIKNNIAKDNNLDNYDNDDEDYDEYVMLYKTFFTIEKTRKPEYVYHVLTILHFLINTEEFYDKTDNFSKNLEKMLKNELFKNYTKEELLAAAATAVQAVETAALVLATEAEVVTVEVQIYAEVAAAAIAAQALLAEEVVNVQAAAAEATGAIEVDDVVLAILKATQAIDKVLNQAGEIIRLGRGRVGIEVQNAVQIAVEEVTTVTAAAQVTATAVQNQNIFETDKISEFIESDDFDTNNDKIIEIYDNLSTVNMKSDDLFFSKFNGNIEFNKDINIFENSENIIKSITKYRKKNEILDEIDTLDDIMIVENLERIKNLIIDNNIKYIYDNNKTNLYFSNLNEIEKQLYNETLNELFNFFANYTNVSINNYDLIFNYIDNFMCNLHKITDFISYCNNEIKD